MMYINLSTILCYPTNCTFIFQYSLKNYYTEAATNYQIIFIDFCFVYSVHHDNSSYIKLKLKTVIILCLIKASKETSMPRFLYADHDKTDGVAVAFTWVIDEGGGELIPVILWR